MPPPRQMVQTLRSKVGDEIKQMSYPDMPQDIYKQIIKVIHTNSVCSNIAKLEHNKVLGAIAPPPQTLVILKRPYQESPEQHFLNSDQVIVHT